MYLKIEDNIIVDAKFKTFGCGAAVATSSMATELVIGKTVDEALNITNKAVAESLDGLPPVKMHCSNLAEEAIKSAIDDYKRKNGLLSDEDACNACSRRCDDVHHHHDEEEDED